MTISLSENAPRVSYAVNEGATQTAFTVPFEFYAEADLNFYVDGTLKTIATHYTVAGGNGTTGTINTTAGNTVTGISGGSTIVITRSIALARTTDFPASGPFAIDTLNTELDKFIAIQADNEDNIGRAVHLADDDTAVSMVLPLVAVRKGTVLGFNASTGAAEIGPTIANVNALSAITANINTTAGIAANVTTVAGIAANVTTVAGVASNVTTVAGSIADVNRLGPAAVVADMALLANTDVIADMAMLATTDIIADMNTLATSAIVDDLNILATTDIVADMAMLATTDIVADLNTLATTAIVADLAILATTDIVADMALLATSDIVTDLNVLATSDIVTDLSILATTDIVADLAILATTDIVADLAILGTSDIVTDLNVLATTAIVADLNLLATSSVIADMATLAGDGANPNITSVTASGDIQASTFAATGDTAADDNASIGYTAAEGLILTGQGSTNDVTIKNDADADVIEIPTGTTNVTVAGNLGVGGTVTGTGTSVFASLDISGDIDVDGTANLDAVDVDGSFAIQQANSNTPTLLVQAATTASDFSISGYSDASGAYYMLGANAYLNSGGNNATWDANENTAAITLNSRGNNGIEFTTGTGTGTNALAIEGDGDIRIYNTGGTLYTSTAGTSNLRLGVNAGNSIASGGNYNVVVGDEAGTAITTGDFNTALGYQAGASVTTGIQNSLIGGTAGDALTTGSYNTAFGISALTRDTAGSKSVAIGTTALAYQNFTSATNSYNVAIGYEAGLSVTTGIRNTIIGGVAGDSLTTANDCVIIGTSAGDALTTGTFNTLIGKSAGEAVTTGIRNTALGGSAASSVTTGTSNVFVGFFSGIEGTATSTGDFNTFVGAYSHGTDATTDGANVLGYNVAGAAGYTTVGSNASDIRAAHGTATWAAVSDERYKKDIVDSTAGLSFINALQPRTFKYKTLGELPETFRAYEADSTEVFKNSNTNHGFIAQEVKTAIDADSGIKDGFKLWDDRDDGSQEVAEAALIPVLTKAVQELSTALDAALARIATLEG